MEPSGSTGTPALRRRPIPGTDELAWITGIDADVIACDDLTDAQRHAITTAARLPASSAIRSGHLCTYAQFAAWLPTEPDWHFAIRALRQCVLTVAQLSDHDDIDVFHAEPPPTGHRGWDALLAGAAVLSGADLVSSPAVLAWTRADHRYSPTTFDPLDTGKYQLLDALRTPAPIAERNIVLARGNLEGL